MDITNLITPERIVCDSEVASKKRVIEVLSELLATGQPDFWQRDSPTWWPGQFSTA